MSLQHAEHLLDLGRPEQALEALAAAGDEGTSPRAHCVRALALLRLGRNGDAGQAAAAARAAAPQWEWGYRLGAIAALRQGHMRAARDLADGAVRVAPDEPFTHQVSLDVALVQGQPAVAKLHADEMLNLAPHLALTHRSVARVLLAQGQAQGAERHLREALALDPQDDEAMSLLADAVAAQKRHDEARDLRLSAVRTDPQNADHQRNLLRGRAAIGGGGLLALSKLGLLGKLFAVNGILHSGALFSGSGGLEALTVGLVVYATCFLVSRVRRRRAGRRLPPSVWEGLRPHRRNADLLWLAWPSGLLAVGGLIGGLSSGSEAALVLSAVGMVLLTAAWRLRTGEARDLRLRDVARQFTWGPLYLFRRLRPPVKAKPDLRGPPVAPPPVDARLARYLGELLLLLVVLLFLGATLPGALVLPALLLAAGLLGAVIDALVIRHEGVPCLVCRDGTTEPATRPQLALRAILRLLLLPVIGVQALLAHGKPARLLHDTLTGTTVTGVRPALRGGIAA